MKIEKLVLGHIENNTYFVSKGEDCIVIDPSMEYEKIYGFIKEHGYNVKAILITHAHYDHVYSLDRLVKDTGAPVYMHEDDMDLYISSLPRIPGADRVKIDFVLKGGEVLDILDEKIEVLHVPGHAKGCVCYIIGEDMFVGDFVFKGSVGRTDLQTSNPIEMAKSLQKFARLNKNYRLYSGHGDESTYNDEMDSNPYLLGFR